LGRRRKGRTGRTWTAVERKEVYYFSEPEGEQGGRVRILLGGGGKKKERERRNPGKGELNREGKRISGRFSLTH